MNVIEFLLEIKELHIFVSQKEGRLTVKGNREALVPELKEKLSQYKSQILDVFAELKIESNKQLAPTTFSQQRLWFIDKLEGGSVHYNMPSATRLRGKISLDAIQQTFNTMIERHESLRTTFTSKGDEPYQVIHHHNVVEGPIYDISQLSNTEQEEEVSRLSQEESNKPFVLEKDLMIRWVLIKLSDEEHILLKTLHHIASDGWSLGVLAREFTALYQAYKKGEPSPLPDLVIQFADYAHWQRKRLKGEVLESQLKHWIEQLEGIPSCHNFPLDKPRPATQGFQGKSFVSGINKEISDAFNKLCFDNGATLFMGIHAVFSLLLSRYSGETDIVIGTPIANREQPDVAPLNGFFLNTLVFRSQLELANDFIELLEQSKNTAWGAYAHQQVPFEQLVSVLNLEQSLSYSPVFQVMLILQNNDSSSVDLPELLMEPLNTGYNTAKFELTLNVIQMDGMLKLGWNYNTDLFDATTMWRLAANFEVLMKSVIESPRSQIMKLALLNDEEYEHCTSVWNELTLPYNKERCVHELFEEQVKEAPQAIAVVTENGQFSYKELNEQSNKLAHYLIAQGVKPNMLVGICMPRTIEMVIAVLAVLKAGGAYVPLDYTYPQQRIDQMCQDSKLNIVLSHSTVEFVSSTEVNCYCLDLPSILQEVSTFSSSNPQTSDVGITANDLAYVIYTSGSTGLPKGVMVSHQNLHAYYTSAKATYQVNNDDRILQFSSFSFDIFVEEMVSSLLSGASLVFRNDKMLLGENHFWDFVNEQGLTILSLPTAFWHELCGQLDGLPLSTGRLKLLVVGGESMSSAMLARWNTCVNDEVCLLNTYGPTEGTVIATYFDLKEFQQQGVIPIGNALPNTQCYVLSQDLQVCPVGVSGELFIGGDAVAQGYLNRPELTREKFIQNPFVDDSSNRLYRTGDIARYSMFGKLEFMGRMDDQVKIRGFRIEPGEIEQLLNQCESVGSTRVLSHESEVGQQSLVAYVLPESDIQLSDNELVGLLRDNILTNLPEYMLPAAFIIVDEWPLTPNGKLDDKMLPAPDGSLHQKEYVAPSTEIEQILVDIWAKLLKLDADIISVTSNFFALGGHSLLVVRLVSEINSQLDQEITIKGVFERSDIKALSFLIESVIKREAVLAKLSSESENNIEEIEW